mmetsp:Transcript_135845/g.307333  ORF Transcript_135845/g.307333 Transcript_135845/m.307333 type:complete len:243 (-) Transcript_135845:211-939(-)
MDFSDILGDIWSSSCCATLSFRQDSSDTMEHMVGSMASPDKTIRHCLGSLPIVVVTLSFRKYTREPSKEGSSDRFTKCGMLLSSFTISSPLLGTKPISCSASRLMASSLAAMVFRSIKLALYWSATAFTEFSSSSNAATSVSLAAVNCFCSLEISSFRRLTTPFRSTSVACTVVLIFFTARAKRRVDKVSSNAVAAGDKHAIIAVRELPVRHGLSNKVSLLFRKTPLSALELDSELCFLLRV